jgi:hypothetical protein
VALLLLNLTGDVVNAAMGIEPRAWSAYRSLR